MLHGSYVFVRLMMFSLGTVLAQGCPECVGYVGTLGEVTRVTVSGSYADVADQASGLRVLPSLDDCCHNRIVFPRRIECEH